MESKNTITKDSFKCFIAGSGSPEMVVGCISNVSGWWATNVSGSTTKPGDIFTVRFGKTFSTIKVAELLPSEKIVWEILDSYLPLFRNEKVWNGTKIMWKISERNKITWVIMTHAGLTPDVECYFDCEKGWNFYIKESLFQLIHTGKGFPGTGIFSNIIADDKKYEGLLFFKKDPLPDYQESFFVDVKETSGEKVISAYAVGIYDKSNFTVDLLKGDHFMIIDKTLLPDIQSLKAIFHI